MAFDDGLEDESPVYRPLLPPEDRVWRHPSETPAARPATGVRLWLVALVSGLSGALLATGLSVVVGRLDGDARVVERVVDTSVPLDVEPVSLGGGRVVAVAERVLPAIVEVRGEGPDGLAQASGVIFRDDGYVLTNQHVVATADRLSVVLSDGREVAAALRGADVETDLAVLRVEGGGRYPTAPMGTAGPVKAGQVAIAVGSPAGSGRGPSVSVGVISGVGRTVERPSPLPDLVDMLQTDAAIAPASSGGPLLDERGAVIGISTVVGTEAAPMLGFATPIDVARAVADELVARGHVVHAWLGVEGSDLDGVDAARLGMAGGVRVAAVVADSPAAAAGLRPGDVIVAVGGVPVRSMSALVLALRGRLVGERVRIGYRRGHERGDAEVTLAPRP